MIDYYSLFIEYHESQGRTFPCTAEAFYSRASAFARAYVITCEEMIDAEELVDLLCCKGIGSNWQDDYR